jgi:hypothetical protein
MNGKRTWNRSGCDVTEVLPRICLGDRGESRKTSVRTVSVVAKSQNNNFQNTSLRRYHYTSQLGCAIIMVFLSVSWKIPEQYLKLGHARFFPLCFRDIN